VLELGLQTAESLDKRSKRDNTDVSSSSSLDGRGDDFMLADDPGAGAGVAGSSDWPSERIGFEGLLQQLVFNEHEYFEMVKKGDFRGIQNSAELVARNSASISFMTSQAYLVTKVRLSGTSSIYFKVRFLEEQRRSFIDDFVKCLCSFCIMRGVYEVLSSRSQI